MIKPLTPEETDLFNKYYAVSPEYMAFGLGRTFNRLRHHRIEISQIPQDTTLQVFAFELKLKVLQQKLNIGYSDIPLSSDKFPGLLENLKTIGRYWVSWYTSNSPENGVTVWPEELKIWNTGSAGDQDALCAVVETGPDFTLIDFWTNLVTYFPDADVRFCTIIGDHEALGDRFPGYDPARTTLKSPKAGVK